MLQDNSDLGDNNSDMLTSEVNDVDQHAAIEGIQRKMNVHTLLLEHVSSYVKRNCDHRYLFGMQGLIKMKKTLGSKKGEILE